MAFIVQFWPLTAAGFAQTQDGSTGTLALAPGRRSKTPRFMTMAGEQTPGLLAARRQQGHVEPNVVRLAAEAIDDGHGGGAGGIGQSRQQTDRTRAGDAL